MTQILPVTGPGYSRDEAVVQVDRRLLPPYLAALSIEV